MAFPAPDAQPQRSDETDQDYQVRQAGELQERKAWDREHRWAPNQLRHAFATKIRRQAGLDAAQVMLGHADAHTTEIYAELDQAKGLQVAARIG